MATAAEDLPSSALCWLSHVKFMSSLTSLLLVLSTMILFLEPNGGLVRDPQHYLLLQLYDFSDCKGYTIYVFQCIIDDHPCQKSINFLSDSTCQHKPNNNGINIIES